MKPRFIGNKHLKEKDVWSLPVMFAQHLSIKTAQFHQKKIVEIVGPNVPKPDKPKLVTKLREIENFIHDTQKE